jgi:tRNA dimethylallyltransferase
LIDHLHGECSLDEAVADIIVHTRQFAVRQERWFRRDPRIRWITVNEDPVAEIAPVLAKFLH